MWPEGLLSFPHYNYGQITSIQPNVRVVLPQKCELHVGGPLWRYVCMQLFIYLHILVEKKYSDMYI